MFIKIYTIFYILLYLIFTFSPEIIQHYGLWEWIDILVMSAALSGMVAYAFRIRILFCKFWEYYFYLFIIFELVYMTWLQLPLIRKLELEQFINANNALNAILLLPVGWAIYKLQQKWDTLFADYSNAKTTKPDL